MAPIPWFESRESGTGYSSATEHIPLISMLKSAAPHVKHDGSSAGLALRADPAIGSVLCPPP
jgi:hypothetical protein